MIHGFVIVRLGGRLGNQLFQYATARAIALRTSQPLFLDFEHDSSRALLGLRIAPARRVGPALALRAGLAPWPGRRRGSRYFCRLGTRRGTRWLKAEAFGRFDPRVLQEEGAVVLWGHWQSERYFADIAPLLRREFQPREEIRPSVSLLISHLQTTPSVGVQIRRGDYLDWMPVEDRPDDLFYVRAVNELAERLGERPVVYGFSDDPAWLQEGFRDLFPNGVPVSGVQTRNQYEDLAAFAACQHQVVSPSTFAWWGAWLNPNPGKLVVAPKRWVYDWAAPDVVPASWLCV